MCQSPKSWVLRVCQQVFPSCSAFLEWEYQKKKKPPWKNKKESIEEEIKKPKEECFLHMVPEERETRRSTVFCWPDSRAVESYRHLSEKEGGKSQSQFLINAGRILYSSACEGEIKSYWYLAAFQSNTFCSDGFPIFTSLRRERTSEGKELLGGSRMAPSSQFYSFFFSPFFLISSYSILYFNKHLGNKKKIASGIRRD